MSNLLCKIAVGLSLPLAVSATAETPNAPHQTTQNAQKFLSLTLPDVDLYDARLGRSRIEKHADDIARGRATPHPLGANFALTEDFIKNSTPVSQKSRVVLVFPAEAGTADYCVTKMELRHKRLVHTVNQLSKDMRSVTGTYEIILAPPLSRVIQIDWGRVHAVDINGRKVLLSTRQQLTSVEADGLAPNQIRDSAGRIDIEMIDEGMAARVRFAAAFLRLACDPTTETGF